MVFVVPTMQPWSSMRSAGMPLRRNLKTMWSWYMSTARRNEVQGTSDGRGSPL